MMTRQMPYSAGAPSRAIVPLAILFPPFPSLHRHSGLLGMLAEKIRRGKIRRRKLPQASIFGELVENRAGSQCTGQESPRSYM
jgi:hypothetical protein